MNSGYMIPSMNCRHMKSESFNSLQTGKHNGTPDSTPSDCTCIHLFQFPSNGKAYVNSKHYCGKCISTRYRFNSLQTGKHIVNKNVQRLHEISRELAEFQFPSNGKAYVNYVVLRANPSNVINPEVSIPFKRESIESEQLEDTDGKLKPPILKKFQFPSNGKAYVNSCYKTGSPASANSRSGIEFQFPSNGKAYVNIAGEVAGQLAPSCSVFQFPSNGKAYVNMLWRNVRIRCSTPISFNSLQTGKHRKSELIIP